MTENFGLVNWDDVEFSNRNNVGDQKRDEFIKLQSGPNEVRLVTKPYQYIVHKWKEEGDRGYGNNVKCSMFHGSCPLCEIGNPPKQRWYVGLIDRKNQTYKILDMSPSIFQKVQALSRKEIWGDPGTYDIDISVDKNSGANGYYSVMPCGKSPLSDNDVEIKQSVDHESLKRRCKPPTHDEVVRIMDAIRKKKGQVSQTVESVKAVSEESVKAVSEESVKDASDNSKDFDFPPANVQG